VMGPATSVDTAPTCVGRKRERETREEGEK
jgi:hypothetical protein